MCGKQRSYGRNLGSVARKGLKWILEESRDQAAGDSGNRAAGAHKWPGTDRFVHQCYNNYIIELRICQYPTK